MKWYQSVILLIGRICLCAIFLMSSVNMMFSFSQTTQYMAGHQMPMPSLFLVGAIALQLVGGLSVVIGYHARIGALLLLIFVLTAAATMHNFWAQPPEMQQQEMIQFMKNISIAGGLLMVIGFGPGPLSVDGVKRLP